MSIGQMSYSAVATACFIAGVGAANEARWAFCVRPHCSQKMNVPPPHALQPNDLARGYWPNSTFWQLRWGDEFENCPHGRVDPDQWEYEYGWVRNEELQYYRKENAECHGGKLHILALHHWPQMLQNPHNESELPAMCQAHTVEASGKPAPSWCDGFRVKLRPIEFTSASITSKRSHTGPLLHGQYDARIKIETEVNSWPAWWSVGLNADGTPAQWPQGGEVDILEYHMGNMFMAVTYAKDRKENRWTFWEPRNGNGFTPENQAILTHGWATSFHNYSLVWTECCFDFFLDGRHMEVTWQSTPLHI